MYHDMSNDIGQEQCPVSKGSDCTPHEDAVLTNSLDVFRNQHVAQRGQLVAELERCHEECATMPALVKGVRLMADLRSQFTFKDAFTFHPRPAQDAADRAVNALKINISAAVKGAASQGDSLCTSPGAREEFSQRLERRFEAIRAHFIKDATSSVEEKLQAMCDRVESIVEHLRCFGAPLGGNCEQFNMFACSLRSYTCEGLGQVTIRMHVPDSGGDAALPVSEFFTQLDTLVVDTLEILRSQAAA